MSIIKGDGIVIATSSGGSGTTQGLSLSPLTISNFSITEGIATFSFSGDIGNVRSTAFLFIITTSTASYLFPALELSSDETSTLTFHAAHVGSSGFSFSSCLTMNLSSLEYTWSLAESGCIVSDLYEGNIVSVSAYSMENP